MPRGVGQYVGLKAAEELHDGIKDLNNKGVPIGLTPEASQQLQSSVDQLANALKAVKAEHTVTVSVEPKTTEELKGGLDRIGTAIQYGGYGVGAGLAVLGVTSVAKMYMAGGPLRQAKIDADADFAMLERLHGGGCPASKQERAIAVRALMTRQGPIIDAASRQFDLCPQVETPPPKKGWLW